MGEIIRLPWGNSRVGAATLDLLEDEERRCLDISILQISVLRQMAFPWALLPSRLVEDHGDWQEIVEQPQAYIDALEELEILLSGAYDGPETGCPVGEVYVDRGDLTGFDFSEATLTRDGGWHVMDLTNVIGEVSATRVLIVVAMLGSVAGGVCRLREADNTATINIATLRVQNTAIYNDLQAEITMSGQQHIEYLFSSTISVIYLGVRGYWMPAA